MKRRAFELLSPERGRSRAALLAPLLSALYLACGSSDGNDTSGQPTTIHFQGEHAVFPGFTKDTGMQPPSSPVQLDLTFNADGKLTVDADATSGGTGDSLAVVGTPGSGSFSLDAHIKAAATLHIDLTGVASYDGPVPGIDNIDIAFADHTTFDPFLIGGTAHVDASLPETKLPPIPLPGGIPGSLVLTVADGSTVTSDFSGVCAGVHDGQVQYVGQTISSGTLVIKPQVVIHLPIGGDKTFDIPEVTLPIPKVSSAMDMGTQPVSAGGAAPMGASVATKGACSAPPPIDAGDGDASDGGSTAVDATVDAGDEGGLDGNTLDATPAFDSAAEGGGAAGQGSVTIVASDDNSLGSGVVGLFVAPGPLIDGCTNIAASYPPSCTLYQCATPSADAGTTTQAYVSAGTLSVVGLSFGSLALSPSVTDQAYVYNGTSGSPLFAFGAPLTVSADGSTFPAFSTSLTAPVATSMTTPDVSSTMLTIPTTNDMVLAWTGGGLGTTQAAYLEAADVAVTLRLVCSFDSSAGTATIPHAALAPFAGMYGSYMFIDTTKTSLSTAGYSVDIEAQYQAPNSWGTVTFQ
jgi:hypothetical protein